MVAILGPSGSGKTSLLNVLSQRHSLSGGSYTTGKVRINGRILAKDGDFGKIAAFVQ
jgi:ABC-type multidrug transport system ATPase subunit